MISEELKGPSVKRSMLVDFFPELCRVLGEKGRGGWAGGLGWRKWGVGEVGRSQAFMSDLFLVNHLNRDRDFFFLSHI